MFTQSRQPVVNQPMARMSADDRLMPGLHAPQMRANGEQYYGCYNYNYKWHWCLGSYNMKPLRGREGE